MSDPATIAFYEANAAQYTLKFGNMPSRHLEAFLNLLGPNAHLLELGCGSGQDSAWIVECGFTLDATDGTRAMVAKTRALRGIDARLMRFQQLDAVERYHAVWAHACLIHVTRDDFPGVLGAIRQSLRPEGLHFANFKLGNGEDHDPLGRLHNFPDAHWLEVAYHEAGFTILASERYRCEGADGVIRDWFALTVRKQ